MTSSYSKAKGRRTGDLFVKLPFKLLDSPAWGDLSPRARDIFIKLSRKYNGRNNGDLSLTLSELRKSGELKSSATLTKALDELWLHGFIVLTREGSFGAARTCNLWGLTTWLLNENAEKGIKGTRKASSDWKAWSPEHPALNYQLNFPKVRAKRKRQASKLKQAA